MAAAEEERFTRIKHDPSLPSHAIAWCLDFAGIAARDLAAVVFYEKPVSTYERILVSAARTGPGSIGMLSRAVPVWSSSKLWVRYRIERLLQQLGGKGGRLPPFFFAEHHHSHQAAAFYPSPFEEAAILTIDGVGEWATTTLAHGRANSMQQVGEIVFPDSLGLLYSAVTGFCGFEVNDGEYKVMGLAPYGEPRYADLMREHLIEFADDGAFRLNRAVFGDHADPRRTNRRLRNLLGVPPRAAGDVLEQVHADVARSVQEVLEDAMLRLAKHAHDVTGASALCLGGGVALNCVANRRLVEEGPFDDVWVPPAPGDGGTALGAALWLWHQVWRRSRPPPGGRDGMAGAFLGPAYEHDEVAEWLTEVGIAHTEYLDRQELCYEIAAALDQSRLVGWFQGRMEFGPRALGHRSILADPRDPRMVIRINSSVKGREGFRPLAPAVLAEHAEDWFDVTQDYPYMTTTVEVLDTAPSQAPPGTMFAERLGDTTSPLPACTHVDGSARLQTVDRARNPEFHQLLSTFRDKTGCPALLNTSFNQGGEPIVRSPADAYRTFVATGLDLLVIEGCVVRRAAVGSRSVPCC